MELLHRDDGQDRTIELKGTKKITLGGVGHQHLRR